MKKWMICVCLAVILQVTFAASASQSPLPPSLGTRPFESPLPQPFGIEPFDTDTLGNSAANTLGSFRQDGGPRQYRYFLGTDLTPGRLIMDFADPFTDGPGNDFAILTNSESWGSLADEAQFQFYFGSALRASFVASLAPNQVFQFELPGSGLVANRVIVTNITPDPAGTNNLATMTFDNAGVAYLCSPPAAPSLTAPADGSSTCDDTPSFDWSDVSGATSYRIQVDNDSNFGSPAVDTTTSNSNYTPASALPPGTYHWRVLSRNACGGGAWSATRTVTVRSAPAAPSLTAPADGSSTCDATPSFNWSDVSGATSYRIQVDNHSNFSSPAIDTTTSNSNYTPGLALPPGTYYWRVLSGNGCGDGAWSVTRTVTVLATPSAPSLTAPADGSSTCDTTPLFDWSDVSGATSYRIQVDNDSNFGSPAVDTTTSNSNHTPGLALPPGTYYWRVLSRNACGGGLWSPTWTVIVLATPAAPSLTAPADGSSTCDTTPLFDWTDVSGATSYQIQVDDSPGFDSPAIDATTSNSDHTPGSALAPGAYHWRVRAANDCEDGAWSATWAVIVLAPPGSPTLQAPDDNSTTSDPAPSFNWTDVSGATAYQIQVDDSPGFDSPTIDVMTLDSDHTSDMPLRDGSYYWRVRAANDCGSGSWSSTRRLSIATQPTDYRLYLPLVLWQR